MSDSICMDELGYEYNVNWIKIIAAEKFGGWTFWMPNCLLHSFAPLLPGYCFLE